MLGIQTKCSSSSQNHCKIELMTQASLRSSASLHSQTLHGEPPPGTTQNLFASLTVRTYVWTVRNWNVCNKVRPKERNVKYSKLHPRANSEFHVQYETAQTRRSVLLPKLCCKVQFGTIHTYVQILLLIWREDFASHLVVFCCISCRTRILHTCCAFVQKLL